jgi:hypothetical protein
LQLVDPVLVAEMDMAASVVQLHRVATMAATAVTVSA